MTDRKTYLVADAGADFQPDSKWALVVGSHWGVCIDPPKPQPFRAHLFTSVEKAEACRANATPGTSGAHPYPWVWVEWNGTTNPGAFRKVRVAPEEWPRP